MNHFCYKTKATYHLICNEYTVILFTWTLIIFRFYFRIFTQLYPSFYFFGCFIIFLPNAYFSYPVSLSLNFTYSFLYVGGCMIFFFCSTLAFFPQTLLSFNLNYLYKILLKFVKSVLSLPVFVLIHDFANLFPLVLCYYLLSTGLIIIVLGLLLCEKGTQLNYLH